VKYLSSPAGKDFSAPSGAASPAHGPLEYFLTQRRKDAKAQRRKVFLNRAEMVFKFALTQSSIHTLTRPAATLSHPMGEGQERIFPFPASLEIPAMGSARPATGKSKRVMGDFLSSGERIKGEGERLLPKTKYGTILAAKTHKRRIKTGPSDRGIILKAEKLKH
jgi:hypothetical protein